MKAFTDISQSEILAEILPIETADMYYTPINMDYPWVWRGKPLIEKGGAPAWSLSALLEVIPYEIVLDEDESLILGIHKEDLQYYLDYGNTYSGDIYFDTLMYDDMIDACVEMILKLHKEKLL